MQFNTKLNIGDKVYIVFGDPLHTIVIISATIYKMVVEKNKSSNEAEIGYYFSSIQIEVDKSKDKKAENNSGFHSDRVGFVYEKYIDKNECPLCCIGFTNAPTFTTKRKCKKYIKQVLATGKR